ncbi:hypothetical protein C8F01DRAFT_997348, partial [Mycena amicta]
DFLRGLYSFANLSNVNIHIPAGFDLDDTAMAELCRAWPTLKSLTLSMDKPAPGGPTFTPPMTLNALTSIAALCPHLFHLRLTLDARIVPRPSLPEPHSGDGTGTRRARVIHRKLRGLFVEFSPISAIHPVARFLSGLFPGIRVSPDSDNDFVDKWMKVSAEVSRLTRIRREERAWAAVDSEDSEYSDGDE